MKREREKERERERERERLCVREAMWKLTINKQHIINIH